MSRANSVCHIAQFGTPLSSLAVGSSVWMNVDGVRTEFLVVHQGTPSSLYGGNPNGTWLLMKDCYESRAWASSNVNAYASSTIHSYLNGTFKNLFDANIRSKMLSVKLPYRAGFGSGTIVTSGDSGLSANIFLLSATEVGLTMTSYNPVNEGTTLSYFSGTATCSDDTKRVANLNESATYWWLRSPYCNTSSDKYALHVTSVGSWGGNGCINPSGIRPALVMPSTATVDDSGNVIP